MSTVLKGKFRHSVITVWCPKPKTKIITNTDLTSKDFLKQTIKNCKCTGWQNLDRCIGCPYIEEFHVDNDGVFCLYPQTNKSKESIAGKQHD